VSRQLEAILLVKAYKGDTSITSLQRDKTNSQPVRVKKDPYAIYRNFPWGEPPQSEKARLTAGGEKLGAHRTANRCRNPRLLIKGLRSTTIHRIRGTRIKRTSTARRGFNVFVSRGGKRRSYEAEKRVASGLLPERRKPNRICSTAKEKRPQSPTA